MASKKPGYVTVRRSRSKKKPFKVTTVANNGEPLQTPQLLTTQVNVRKNLLSVMATFHGTEVIVHDYTGRKPKEYTLSADGLITSNDAEDIAE